MPILSGIYDSDRIQPVARIKENLSVLTSGRWRHWLIDYQEPIPPGPASTVEMITLSGATVLAANATIAKRVVAVLQLNANEFLHLRWEPLDDVEGVLWQLPSQARFSARAIHARVNKLTRLFDPTLASTTFWIIGLDRDMNLEVRNPQAVAIHSARFMFRGYRYLLTEHPNFLSAPEDDKAKLGVGDIETVRRYIGPTTWLPAEGKTV